MTVERTDTPTGYSAWLADLKTRIRETRLRAALTVNSELISLYWQIGRDIRERQVAHGWGAKVVDRLAADLRAEFPDSRGFSSANLRYMRAFAAAWPDPAILQRVVGKLPWGQNIELLAVKDPAARLWYAEATLEHGWSRPVLAHQIATRLKDRQGQAVTNFARTLPPIESDLAQQIVKDPYQFDFLTVAADAWNARCWCGSRTSCSRWARASPSSAVSIIWRSVVRIGMSISCSIIAGCAASSPSISKSVRSSPNMPVR